jgi:tripartite-type tricarboxylate transporter receptor subunit TctC
LRILNDWNVWNDLNGWKQRTCHCLLPVAYCLNHIAVTHCLLQCKERAMKRSALLWVVLGAALVLVTGRPVRVTAAEFYKGKTIRIIVPFSPGGGFDSYSRAIARHIGKHIPGHPTVMVENTTGAGGLIAYNYVYKVAKTDGLTIANFHGYQILNQLIGLPGIEFDARKFEWIGVPVGDTGACALTKASGITSLEKWREAKTPVKLGAIAQPGDTTYNSAKILKDVLHLPIQLVAGYKGTSDIRLAAESGEVAGGCWTWESISPTWRTALDAGTVSVVVQLTPRPHPELTNVPLIIELAKTDEARLLLNTAIIDSNAMVRNYILPPGTPKDRVQTLRRAFMDTMKDSEFLVDANKAKLVVDPVSGEEVERTVARFFKLDSKIVARLKEILLR